MSDFVVTQTVYIETYKNPRPRGLYDLWIASWRNKDDPTYYECENCAGSDSPTEAYGRTRKKAIKNARRILGDRASIQAKRIRRERESDQSLQRHKIEFDVTDLKLAESDGE